MTNNMYINVLGVGNVCRKSSKNSCKCGFYN